VNWMTWRATSVGPYPHCTARRTCPSSESVSSSGSSPPAPAPSPAPPASESRPRTDGDDDDAEARDARDQGLTLVHFSAQRKRFLRDRGCGSGLFEGCVPCNGDY